MIRTELGVCKVKRRYIIVFSCIKATILTCRPVRTKSFFNYEEILRNVRALNEFYVPGLCVMKST